MTTPAPRPRPAPFAVPAVRGLDAAVLASALANLTVHVDSVVCRTGGLSVEGYPGGPRPTSVVAISGRGETGYGENVAFSDAEQRAFARRIDELILCRAGKSTVGDAVAVEASAYERATLQCALIDLGLRQHRSSLRDLCGDATVPRISGLRWIASFGAMAQPARYVRGLRTAGRAVEFKVDVHPAWTDEDIDDLARETGIVTLDFKEGATVEIARRLSERFARTVFEDPPPGTSHPMIARDRPLLRTADMAAAARRGEIVNLKIPRLGGPIALLEALSEVQRLGGACYFGGMFEVGPGREQARQLAALFCGDAPNDLGPLLGALAPTRPRSPSWVRVDTVGFGATCAWSQLEPSSA